MLPIVLAVALAAFPFPERPPQNLFGDLGETTVTFETLRVLEWYARQYDALRPYAIQLDNQRAEAVSQWKAERELREQLQGQIFWKDVGLYCLGGGLLLTTGGFLIYAVTHQAK